MMQSHIQSLIAKAHKYQAEPDRFQMLNADPLTVSVHGANGDHTVTLSDGSLICTCDAFSVRGERICPHVMAVEHHFQAQVPSGAVRWPFAVPA